MEPKKKSGKKRRTKKRTLENKSGKNNAKRNVTFLWFKLISSIHNNIKKGRPIRVPY